mmetsp:Transcript_65037/g.103539  ORF Transcript_65037/g.103539 Transcript_65037/m.103539 type:complete len:385 (-) Transcript_65037:126-1280(-)
MSTLHTTLAQDSFRLYFGVIDYVIEHLKNDLKKKGHDEEEATEIVNKLQKKWKENLHKSGCIDNKNMLGFVTPSTNNNNHNHNNTDSTLSHTGQLQSASSSFTHLSHHMLNEEGPVRKRQRTVNANNSHLPPPLHSPHVMQANYAQNNPHIQGLGVPQIDQIHNPFEHPQTKQFNLPQNDGGNDIEETPINPSKPELIYEGPVHFKCDLVQNDGPPPMKPTTVGFDDDEEDEEEEEDDDLAQPPADKQNAHKPAGKKKRSDKEENDDDDEPENASNHNETSSSLATTGTDGVDIHAIDHPVNEQQTSRASHIVNGRDLNAPLCSEDDDTDDQEDLDPRDKIICQFTKVHRKKNEWTVDLKHGLMHINGKDYAFQKATGGSFSWK